MQEVGDLLRSANQARTCVGQSTMRLDTQMTTSGWRSQVRKPIGNVVYNTMDAIGEEKKANFKNTQQCQPTGTPTRHSSASASSSSSPSSELSAS